MAMLFAVVTQSLGLWQRPFGYLTLAMALGGTGAMAAGDRMKEPGAPAPIRREEGGFVSSGACRSCHPAEHESWRASFHRSMTQSATLSQVASPELRRGGRLHAETGGRTVELFARGNELWSRLPDPGLTSAGLGRDHGRIFRAAPSKDARVQLLTGSHHQQAFWVKGARGGELRALPVVYLIAEARLIPRQDAFLSPPDADLQSVSWNSNCIQCHAVAGAPGHDPKRDVFESSAAELGIACEACHGPGAAHVRAMQSPVARYQAHASGTTKLDIVNPLELSAERASQVCARCHSYFFPKDQEEWWSRGFSRSFLPGDDLGTSQLLLSPEVFGQPGAPTLEESTQSLFYQDGTIRVGGREHNGLVRSPCFERGTGKRQLSCLSCHSLHRSEPQDQLGAGKDGNSACTPCHEREGAELSRHTRHAPSSPGSLCYNCHMPHTTYALLGAIRSHRIDSPSFDQRTRDRPNACSLCHLEQSEAWAAEKAAELFGAKPAYVLAREPGLAAPEAPAGAVFALAGDAAVRAIAAAALSRHESHLKAPELRRQLLNELATDPYAAVRFVAQRSLRTLPMPPIPQALPLDPSSIARLKQLRDNRPVTIAE